MLSAGIASFPSASGLIRVVEVAPYIATGHFLFDSLYQIASCKTKGRFVTVTSAPVLTCATTSPYPLVTTLGTVVGRDQNTLEILTVLSSHTLSSSSARISSKPAISLGGILKVDNT